MSQATRRNFIKTAGAGGVGAAAASFAAPAIAQSAPEIKWRLAASRANDCVLAFRGASYPWMQVGELSYDAFMTRMRTRT